jgi:hypothetical protein
MLSFRRLISESRANPGYFRAYDMNEHEQDEDVKK